jgi:hypothetical protein
MHEGEQLEIPPTPVAAELEKRLGLCGKFLRKAMGDFWRIVSGLLTPKEWTVKGEVSGLLLKGAVEIKFGRQPNYTKSAPPPKFARFGKGTKLVSASRGGNGAGEHL